MARVSVVMAVYNAAPFVKEAVGSILAQTFKDFEFIIVDDASSDSSPEILKAFDDPRIRVITHTRNKGAALSRNDAIALARGEYIAVMDADDVSERSRLDAQIQFLDRRPDIGLLGTGVYDSIDLKGSMLCTSYLPEDNDTIQHTLMQRWCFLHPSIMFRAEVVERVGGYRPEFEPAEDHDFILRVLEHYKAHNLNEKLVGYRINFNGISSVAHDYVDALGEVAMRLALERRQGGQEDFERAVLEMAELKRRRHTLNRAPAPLRAWRNSRYASSRYYGFGCKELCAGNLNQARRCFVRSVRANWFFFSSWVGLSLSFFPSLVERIKFVFRSSTQYHNELDRIRGAVPTEK